MAADKPARQISKLTEQLRVRAAEAVVLTARVGELERQLAELEQRRTVDALQISAARESRDKLLLRLHDEQRCAIARAESDAAMIVRAAELLGDASTGAAMVADPVTYVGKLKARHRDELILLGEEIEAQLARGPELDAKEAELRALVAGVEDRMKTRERQDASAILNRRAIAGVVPGKIR